MTRKTVLANIKNLISDSDIVFCIGKALCDEALVFTDGTFWVTDDYIDGFSLAVGTAITTTKRVIIIAEDGYLLRYYSSILQAAASKCTNLFFIILVSNSYNTVLPQCTLTESLRSIEGILFNTGFLTHNYSIYFKNKSSLNKLKLIYKRTMGPVIGLISVTSGRLYNSSGSIKKTDINSFKKFIASKELKTSMEKIQQVPLNLDEIMKGA